MDIPAPIRNILLRLHRAGYAAYAVGGCIRDALLGLEPHDWDVCTAAAPGEVEAVFSDCRCLETGLRHGTVTVLWEGRGVEITTFRTDGAYRDGRHPESVRFTASLEEDLARRDFTCNAMAWDGVGGIVDPFGGRDDLRRGLLRCVGEPERRFREDALRLLRALRFAARYGFTVEPATGAALHREAALLGRVSAERCFSELKGILCAPHAGDVLREYGDVLRPILPELSPEGGTSAEEWEVTCRTLDAAPSEEVLRLALLLRGRQAGEILRRLRCDRATLRAAEELAALCLLPPPDTPAAQRRELSQLGEEQSLRLARLRLALAEGRGQGAGAARKALELQAAALREGGCLTLRELAVDGSDLLALGVRPGAELGALLRGLLDAVLDGDAPNEREALLALARDRLGDSA